MFILQFVCYADFKIFKTVNINIAIVIFGYLIASTDATTTSRTELLIRAACSRLGASNNNWSKVKNWYKMLIKSLTYRLRTTTLLRLKNQVSACYFFKITSKDLYCGTIIRVTMQFALQNMALQCSETNLMIFDCITITCTHARAHFYIHAL